MTLLPKVIKLRIFTEKIRIDNIWNKKGEDESGIDNIIKNII